MTERIYKGIIFDFFGVICHDVAPNWFRKRVPEDRINIEKEKYYIDYDLGKISDTELVKELSEKYGDTPEEINREFDSYAVINTELVEFIKELKNNYKIGVCSNGSSEFIKKILAKNNVGNIFDSMTVSSDLGVMKPGQKIYLEALKSLGLASEEVIFIDDTEINVKVAESLGMKGILFESTQKLKEILEKI